MARHVQIFAHKGANRVAPENTLPAFAAALDMGVDGIELDTQCSRDGVLVVIHDFTVDHATNGQGRVADLTQAELARLDAGSHFAADFAGVSIPMLDEVFDLVGDRCRLNVEVKSMDPEGGPEADVLLAAIRRRNLYDQVIVSSFNPMTLIKLRWLEPRLALGVLHGKDLPPHLAAAWTGPVIRPEALHPHHTLVNAAYMDWAGSASCAVNTWTVNDVDEARRLADLGVATIITDAPDVLMAALAAV